MITKAVIPIAGKGTRLFPISEYIPKCLLGVGNKFMVEHVLDEAEAAGIKHVQFVISSSMVNDLSRKIRPTPRLSMSYVIQEKQLGLANAVYCAKDFVGDDPFVIMLGDSLVISKEAVNPTRRLIKSFKAFDSGAILVQDTPKEELYKYGIVKPIYNANKIFEIDSIVEKPTIETAPSKYSIAGRYIFTPDIFTAIENTEKGLNDEYQLADAINILLKTNRVWCMTLENNERRIDIGTPDTYKEACELMKGIS